MGISLVLFIRLVLCLPPLGILDFSILFVILVVMSVVGWDGWNSRWASVFFSVVLCSPTLTAVRCRVVSLLSSSGLQRSNNTNTTMLYSYSFKSGKARQFLTHGHFLLLSQMSNNAAALSFMKDRQFKDKVSVPSGFAVVTTSGHLLEAVDDNFIIESTCDFTVLYSGKPALYSYSQQQQTLGRPKGSDIVSLDKKNKKKKICKIFGFYFSINNCHIIGIAHTIVNLDQFFLLCSLLLITIAITRTIPKAQRRRKQSDKILSKRLKVDTVQSREWSSSSGCGVRLLKSQPTLFQWSLFSSPSWADAGRHIEWFVWQSIMKPLLFFYIRGQL